MDFTLNGNNWLSRNLETFKAPNEDPQHNKKAKKKIKLAVIHCRKCNELIKEKHLFAIGENYWHKCCVRCDSCEVLLNESVFLIENTLLCRLCYNQSVHVTKCFGCKLPIQTQDVVMYALNEPYHLSCFKCNFCQNVISKGDKFVFQSGLLICKHDYENETYMNSQLSHSVKQQPYKLDNQSESNTIRRKTKISIGQRQCLEGYYISNSNPSIKQRAYIAEELNLPLKVVQTWFCNYRTKMKTHKNHDLKLVNEKMQANDRSSSMKVKRMLEQQQQQCFTPDLDCPTNCQISQSTEDHVSPQDLSSDLSGMYTCPELIGRSYHSQQHSRVGNGSSNSDNLNAAESIDDGDCGLTYADLSNSCVKSSMIDRFSGSVEPSTKTCLTWT